MRHAFRTLIPFVLGLTTISPSARALPRADSLFQAALSRVDSVSSEEAVKAFRRVLDVDGDYAPAYHEIAKLYLARRTVGDRQRALNVLLRAVRLDRANLRYRMTLADLRWQQGFWDNARHAYEVLSADTGDPRAALQAGYHALHQFLKYRDMIDWEGGVLFTWNHFALEDYERAVTYLEKAIESNPRLRDAYYHLGLARLENGDPEGLVEVSGRLLARDPEDKDALLFCGLGQQRLGRDREAFVSYSRAIEQMGPEERSVVESVEALVPPAEAGALNEPRAKPASGVRWSGGDAREAFWRRQDPLFLTPYNERRMEHYGRVAYANLRFSRPWKGIAGWQTDPGRALIRYGAPLSKSAQRPEMEAGSITAHTDTWFYEGFSLTFRNLDGLDGWGFEKSRDHVCNYETSCPEETFSRLGPRYVDPYLGTKFTLPHLLAAFRDSGETRLVVAYAVPHDRMTQGTQGRARVDDGLFLFDGSWGPLGQRVGRLDVRAPQASEAFDEGYTVSRHVVHLTPGAYHVVAELRNPVTRAVGTFREERVLPPPADGLAVSDLLLARRIVPRVATPAGWNDLDIVPNPIRTYGPGQRVTVYFEVYGLGRDAFGQTSYEVAYRVGPVRGADPTLFEPVDALELAPQTRVEDTRGDEESTPVPDARYRVRYILPERNRVAEPAPVRTDARGLETTVTARYRGGQAEDFTYLEIDVRPLPPGVHELTVTVRDLATLAEVEARALFRVR